MVQEVKRLVWEYYLSWIYVPSANKIVLARLRTSCHQLEIEVSRHHKPPIPENKRICKFCSTSSIDNETHFLIECPATDPLQQTLLNTVQSIHPHFPNLSIVEKMKLTLGLSLSIKIIFIIIFIFVFI